MSSEAQRPQTSPAPGSARDSGALPVIASICWLLPPLTVVVWALLGPVAANPENPPDRRGLLGLMRLALDSDLTGVALLSGATFLLFATALLVTFGVLSTAGDVLVACARRGAGADRLPLGLLRRALSLVQVLTVAGMVTAAATYVTIVRDPLIDPVWTALLLVGGGAYLVWSCARSRRALT